MCLQLIIGCLKPKLPKKLVFSSTPLDRLPSKPEPNPREHYNCVTLKEEIEDSTDPEDVPIEKGRKIIIAGSKEQNNGNKTATFKENDTVEFPIIFPTMLPDPSSFSIPCIVGKVEVERALCDLGASISIIPYFLFHKPHLGPLLAAPLSPQLADSFNTQPIGRLDDVPVNIGDIWVLEDLIIVDMLETDDAQIILSRLVATLM